MPKPLSPEQLAILRAAPMASTITNRVRLAMALTDTSLKDLLADMPGGQYSHISGIARGRSRDLRLNTARPFAKFFGCAMDDLFPEILDERTDEAA